MALAAPHLNTSAGSRFRRPCWPARESRAYLARSGAADAGDGNPHRVRRRFPPGCWATSWRGAFEWRWRVRSWGPRWP